MITTLLLTILNRFETGDRESSLKAEARLSRRVGEDDFRDALRDLKDAGFIESEVNPLTKNISWKITEAGRAYIRGKNE